MLKQPGGVLSPADDIAAEYLTKLKTGEVYPVDIKRSRNPNFHGKVFAFFQFAFNYWRGECEFQEEAAQIVSLKHKAKVRPSETMIRAFTAVPHKWTIYLAAIGRDWQGNFYTKSLEVETGVRCLQNTLAD